MADDFPDIIGDARVITRAMLDRCVARMEEELATLDRQLAEDDEPGGGR